jgi:hypothetical protein
MRQNETYPSGLNPSSASRISEMTVENLTASAQRDPYSDAGDINPKRRPHAYLEAVMIGAAVLGVLNMCMGSADTTGTVLSDATRYFVAGRLDKTCSAEGMLVDRGMPCAEHGGFRFVLGGKGRYEIYAVEGMATQLVARSDGSPAWTGTSEQLAELERLTAGTEVY